MPIDVSIPVGGPAYATWDGVTWQLGEDWTVDEINEQGEIKTNLQGVIEQRDDIMGFSVKLPLLAVWGNLAKMFPYSKTSVGNLARPSTDKPLVIQTKAGQSITFPSAFVYASPQLSLTASPKKRLLGTMEMWCLIKTNVLPSASGAFVTLASSSYSEPTLDPTTILSPRFTAQWGDTPTGNFANIETMEGWTFDAKYSFERVIIDTVGLVNVRVTDVMAMVEAKPVNLSEADYLTTFHGFTGTSARGRGKRLPSGLFTCIGANTGDPSLTLPSAQAMPGGLAFGKDGRVQSVKLQAAVKASAGVLQSLFTLATV